MIPAIYVAIGVLCGLLLLVSYVERVYAEMGQPSAVLRQFQELERVLMKELGEATVVATGGLAALIAPYSDAIQYHEPWLTLHGLRLIFEKNSPPAA